MSFAIVTLFIAAGLVGPMFSGFKRFALPMVAGEIIAGVIIGKSGFNLINTSDHSLQFISNVGFSLLLFLVGQRLMSTNDLKANLPRGLLAAALSAAIGLPLGFLLAHLTHIGHAGMFTLLCVCSSTSTVMPILAERKLGGPVVSVLSTWIPIADIATMVALPLAVGGGSAVAIIVGAGVITLCGVVCFFVLRSFKLSNIGERYRTFSKERRWALDLRMQLLVLFGLAALANVFGTSILVAGFVTGAVSAKMRNPDRFSVQLTGIAEGLFVPFFFVFTGARINVLDLVTVPANLELLGLIVAAALVTHVIAARLLRLPLSAGLIATQQMGLPAAIVALALSGNIITEGQAAAIVSAALITLVFCSIGTNMLARQTPLAVMHTAKAEEDEDS